MFQTSTADFKWKLGFGKQQHDSNVSILFHKHCVNVHRKQRIPLLAELSDKSLWAEISDKLLSGVSETFIFNSDN